MWLVGTVNACLTRDALSCAFTSLLLQRPSNRFRWLSWTAL